MLFVKRTNISNWFKKIEFLQQSFLQKNIILNIVSKTKKSLQVMWCFGQLCWLFETCIFTKCTNSLGNSFTSLQVCIPDRTANAKKKKIPKPIYFRFWQIVLFCFYKHKSIQTEKPQLYSQYQPLLQVRSQRAEKDWML